MWASQVVDKHLPQTGGCAAEVTVLTNKRLILAHFWLAFAVFGLALLLGACRCSSAAAQCLAFQSDSITLVTAHGSAMGMFSRPGAMALAMRSRDVAGRPLIGGAGMAGFPGRDWRGGR